MREDQDVAHERRVEVTDEQFLDMWLTAGVSAVATMLVRSGAPANTAVAIARSSMAWVRDSLQVDPLAREELLERIHAQLHGENPASTWVRAGGSQ